MERQRTSSGPSAEDQRPVEPPPGSRLRMVLNLLLILIVLAISFRVPMLRALGRGLVREDSPRQADLMVLPAGSPAVSALAASDYYRQGLAPLIFMSRGGLVRGDLVRDLDLDDAGNWGLTFRILTAKGVPAEVIIRDNAFSDSACKEAERVKSFCKGRQVRSVILVTSRPQSHRARLTFTRVLGPDIEVISLPSRYDPFDPDNWWSNPGQAERLALEYQKLAFYYLGCSED